MEDDVAILMPPASSAGEAQGQKPKPMTTSSSHFCTATACWLCPSTTAERWVRMICLPCLLRLQWLRVLELLTKLATATHPTLWVHRVRVKDQWEPGPAVHGVHVLCRGSIAAPKPGKEAGSNGSMASRFKKIQQLQRLSHAKTSIHQLLPDISDDQFRHQSMIIQRGPYSPLSSAQLSPKIRSGLWVGMKRRNVRKKHIKTPHHSSLITTIPASASMLWKNWQCLSPARVWWNCPL